MSFGSLADITARPRHARYSPKEDIHQRGLHVRLVPKADISGASFVAWQSDSGIKLDFFKRLTEPLPGSPLRHNRGGDCEEEAWREIVRGTNCCPRVTSAQSFGNCLESCLVDA